MSKQDKQANRRTPAESTIPNITDVLKDQASESTASGEDQSISLRAIAILEARCLNCHASGRSAPDWLISVPTTENDWVTKTPFGLVVKGNPSASRLLIRMLHSTEAGNMPPGATTENFPKVNYEIVHQWIEELNNPKQNASDQGSGDDKNKDKNKGGIEERPKALTYVDGYCMGCHSGAGATSWNVPTGATPAKWISDTPQGLIVPGKASESRLVKFMIYSQNGSMPVGATTASFPKAHFDEIVAWINSLPEPVIEPIDNGGLKAGDVVYSSDSKLRLGDRNYVADVLFEVYGKTVVGESIRSYLLPFGGPCTTSSGWTAGYKGNECITTRAIIDPARSSNSFVPASVNSVTHSLSYNHIDKLDLTTANAPLVPDSTVVREGYRTLACDSISFEGTYNNADPTKPLLVAIQKVRDLASALQNQAPTTVDFSTYPVSGSIPSDIELRIAHMLFFNFSEPSPEQITSLRAVATRANQNDIIAVSDWPKRFEPWRYVFYTICLTPDWQIP